MKPSLGVGLDTPWGSPRGLNVGHSQSNTGSALQSFLDKNGEGFETFFFSFQRKHYGSLRTEDYLSGFQHLYERARKFAKRINLHHTMLNLGSTLPYRRDEIIQVTNEISEALPFEWINEDVGIWFLEGKSVPYPLPPILTKEALKICKQNVVETRAALQSELSIEFPGITDGASFQVGNMDLFEFFAEIADHSQCLVTLDTGHLLGWEWSQNRFHDEMFRHLENFPFEQVVEIHMAGSESKNGAFIDRHHGILLDEQFEVLEFLKPRCKNLEVITYEDPKFDLQGNLIPQALPSLQKLKKVHTQWTTKEDLPI